MTTLSVAPAFCPGAQPIRCSAPPCAMVPSSWHHKAAKRGESPSGSDTQHLPGSRQVMCSPLMLGPFTSYIFPCNGYLNYSLHCCPRCQRDRYRCGRTFHRPMPSVPQGCCATLESKKAKGLCILARLAPSECHSPQMAHSIAPTR